MDPDEEFGFVADEPPEIEFAADPDVDLPGRPDAPPGYGYRESETSTRVELPETTFVAGGPTVEAEGPARVVTERVLHKLPSAHDVAPGTQVAPDRREIGEQLEGWRREAMGAVTGREITPASLRRAASAIREGRVSSPGEALEVAVPTAPRPETMAPSEPDYRTQALWQGLGEAVTFGGVDEIGAALGPGVERLRGETQGQLYTEGAPTYESRRDALRERMGQTREQAPAGVALGQLAGTAPLALLGGGATPLARAGAQAAYGVGTGALRGLGESEAQSAGGILGDVASQAALEGVTAGALSGGAEVLRRGLGALGRARGSDMLTTASLRARGLNPDPLPRGPLGRQYAAMGGRERVGQVLRERGVGGRLPTPPAAIEDIARVADESRQMMGSVTRAMDEAGARVDMHPYLQEMGGIASRMENARLPDTRAAGQTFRRRVVDPLREAGAEGLTFSEAHALRMELDDLVTTFRAEPSLRQLSGQALTARRVVSRLMDEAAERLDPALRQQWRAGNEGVQLGYMLNDFARETSSNLPGAVSEGVLLSQALSSGEPSAVAGALAARAGGRLLGRVGPGMREVGARGIAGSLRALGPGAARFADILDRAGQQGGLGVPTAHYILQRTRPDYRRAVEQAREREQEQR